MDNLLLPWLAEIGFITWRDFHNEKRPPLPSELLSTFIIFGAFTLASQVNTKLGAALGWGIVVATALDVFNPAATSISDLLTPAASEGETPTSSAPATASPTLQQNSKGSKNG